MLQTDYDPQDTAEVFDETHRTDESEIGGDDLDIAADLDPDVDDVTSAVGDSEEDAEVEADDMDPEDLDDLDLDDDEEDDEEDEDEDDDLDDEDEDLDDDEDEEDDDDLADDDEADPKESAHLDQDLEDTFPASDPIPAQHIS